jgi:hypothetical protein
MKQRIPLFVLAILSLTSVGDAEARRNRKMGGEKYVANGTFGLGLELGAPFGINGKYFLSDDRALNFGVGTVYDNYYDDRDGLHLYLDYMFHPFSITNQPAFQMPFFVGVGGRIWNFDDRRRRFDDDNNGVALGVRVPVGIAFEFNKVPLDVWIQLTFVADLFFGYEDRFGPHLEGSIGIRYWFD